MSPQVGKTESLVKNEKFFQQKDGMAMGSCLSNVLSIIIMETFEGLALDVKKKSLLWVWYCR
jgi:hypothetical protein